MNIRTCKHCGSTLIIKQTRKTSEQLKKQFHYTAYYFCSRCKRLYLDEKFKIVNESFDLFSGMQKDSGEPVDVKIWTDGACVNNGKETAKAAWAFVSGDIEKAGLVFGKQTNNRAEAIAIFEALKWAAEIGYKRIKIYTDTQITLHSLRKPVEKVKANREIFIMISQLITKYNLEVIYKKVLGHSGNTNNDRADVLANSLVSN
jgi:ribonuclease HI